MIIDQNVQVEQYLIFAHEFRQHGTNRRDGIMYIV